MPRFAAALGVCLVATCAASAQAATIAVSVDASQDRRAIDPQIYGVNFAKPGQLVEPGMTVNRWGGNATTRYNYLNGVSNRGNDFVYLNVAEGDGTDLPNNSSANQFLAATLAANQEPLLTIGTIGWRPLDTRDKRYGFAIAKYGPQTGDGCSSGHDCAGGNGRCNPMVNVTGYCPNGPADPDYIVGNDPLDTSLPSTPAWTTAWIQHLKTRHGSAANGGVRYYALDNEVMLWHDTHRDVHPLRADYEEIWDKTVAYASAIKAEEPTAQVFGPVTWGYCDLFGSAADNCHVGPERDAHGGLPFVQWYLRQVCAYQQANGLRLVDYLDLHYYPQGANVIDFDSSNLGVTENEENSAKRLRSLKELYDPNWDAESWMGTLGDYDQYHYTKPQFIRRVRAWIDAECPGTKLAITEYNWGPDLGASGALAQAEVLAIFGREGVDLATRWSAPEVGSLVERAFRLFLNYDGNGARVVGDSVRAVSANIDMLGAYAVELSGERLMVLLFNKDTEANTAQLSFAAPLNGAWTLYRFDADTNVSAVANGNIAGSALTLANLPARSANLLVIPLDINRIFANSFE